MANINLAQFIVLKKGTVDPYCKPLAWFMISEAKVGSAILFNLVIKVLLILPQIAASINEVGFHAAPAFPSPASASTARYPLQLGRLEQCE